MAVQYLHAIILYRAFSSFLAQLLGQCLRDIKVTFPNLIFYSVDISDVMGAITEVRIGVLNTTLPDKDTFDEFNVTKTNIQKYTATQIVLFNQNLLKYLKINSLNLQCYTLTKDNV